MSAHILADDLVNGCLIVHRGVPLPMASMLANTGLYTSIGLFTSSGDAGGVW